MKTKLSARLVTKINGGKLKMTNISKKILAIMVLAVFVLSIVPIVWAEDVQPGAENQAEGLAEPNQGQAQPVPGQNVPGQFIPEPKQFNQVGNQPGKNQPANKPFIDPKNNPMKVGSKSKEGKESQGQEGEFEGEFQGEFKEPQEGEDINGGIDDKEGKKEDQGFKPKFPQFINDFFNKWKKQPFEPGAAEPQGQFGQPGAMPPGQPGQFGEQGQSNDQNGQPGQMPPRMLEDKSEGCWVGEELVPVLKKVKIVRKPKSKCWWAPKTIWLRLER